MIKKVRQLTADFKKLSSAQVSETSKKAIRQNQNLWEGLNRLDAVARRAIDNNERTKQRLQGIGNHFFVFSEHDWVFCIFERQLQKYQEFLHNIYNLKIA